MSTLPPNKPDEDDPLKEFTEVEEEIGTDVEAVYEDNEPLDSDEQLDFFRKLV